MRKQLIAPLVASLVLLSVPALANGRYPYGNQLTVHPRNPDIILVRTTFGLLLSEDHGKKFHWICEPLIGFSNNLDPGVAVFDNGAYAVAGYYGLAISQDNACSFPFVGGDELKNQYVIDIAVDKANPTSAVAVTAIKPELPTSHVQVYQTSNNGETWAGSGIDLPTDLTVTTLDVAPSDPNRVYIAGAYVTPEAGYGFVQRSNDRGKTWGPRVSVKDVTALYISGVDPKDPDRVFVRAFETVLENGVGSQHDRLLVSADGFTTFESAITFTGTMYGFAISPDGSKIAIGGSGDGVYVAPRPSTGTGYQFVKRSSTSVNCLKWTDETLYGCGFPNKTPGSFVVARSDDEGATWAPLVASLDDIVGPLDRCPSSSPYNLECISDWKRQVCLFAKPGALDACADAVKDAGTPAPPPGPVDDGSCALRTFPGGAPKTATGIAAIVFALGLTMRRIRRRR